jgi:hypothetical protein
MPRVFPTCSSRRATLLWCRVEKVSRLALRAGRAIGVQSVQIFRVDGHSGDRRHVRVVPRGVQPVLRAGGRTVERFRFLDDWLREVQRASPRSTLSALPGVVGLALTVQVLFTVLLVLGAYLAVGGNVGAAEVLAILVLAARCADPVLSLSVSAAESAAHVPSWRDSTRCCAQNRCRKLTNDPAGRP